MQICKVFTNIYFILCHFKIVINVKYYVHKKYMDEGCGVWTKRTGQKEPASKLLGQKVPGQKELHHRTKSTSYLYLKQIVTFMSITHVNFICISFNTF